MTKQHSKTQSQASRRTGAKVRGLPARLLNLALACVMAVTMIPALSLSADPPSRPDVIDVLINSGPGSALLGSDVNDLLDPAIRAEFERVLFELHKGNDLTDFPSPSALFTTLTPLPCVNAGCTPTTVAPACRAAINALIPTVQVRQPRPVDIRANDLRDWIVYTRFDGSVINSWTAADARPHDRLALIPSGASDAGQSFPSSGAVATWHYLTTNSTGVDDAANQTNTLIVSGGAAQAAISTWQHTNNNNQTAPNAHLSGGTAGRIPRMYISDWVNRAFADHSGTSHSGKHHFGCCTPIIGYPSPNENVIRWGTTPGEPVVRNYGRPHTDNRITGVGTINNILGNPNASMLRADTLGAFESHILSHDDRNGKTYIDFMGYRGSAYQDFLWFPCQSAEPKTVTFEVHTANLNPHTLDGFGFLVNAGTECAAFGTQGGANTAGNICTQTDCNGTRGNPRTGRCTEVGRGLIDGYLLYFGYVKNHNFDSTREPGRVALYRLQGPTGQRYTAAQLHTFAQEATGTGAAGNQARSTFGGAGRNNAFTNNYTVTGTSGYTYANTRFQLIAGRESNNPNSTSNAALNLDRTVWADANGQMEIKLTITPTSVKVYQRALTEKGERWESNHIILDTAIGNPLDQFVTGVGTTGTSLGLTRHHGFGPYVGYNRHGCPLATQFTFADIHMDFIPQSDDIFDVLSESNYVPGADKYFVDLTDNGNRRRMSHEQGRRAAGYLDSNNIYYITNYPNTGADENRYVSQATDPNSTITKPGDAGGIADEIAAEIVRRFFRNRAQDEPAHNAPPLDRPVANLELRHNSVTGTRVTEVAAGNLPPGGFPVFAFNQHSVPSNDQPGRVIYNWEFLTFTGPEGFTPPPGVVLNDIVSNRGLEALFIITNDPGYWPAGDYVITMLVRDHILSSDAAVRVSERPVEVRFTILRDVTAPEIPWVNINTETGKMTFVTRDIDRRNETPPGVTNLGVKDYELVITYDPGVGPPDISELEQFAEDKGGTVDTTTPGSIRVRIPVSAAQTTASQSENITIGDIPIPVGDYTWKLIVYDVVNNSTTVNLPSFDYDDPDNPIMIGLKANTPVERANTPDPITGQPGASAGALGTTSPGGMIAVSPPALTATRPWVRYANRNDTTVKDVTTSNNAGNQTLITVNVPPVNNTLKVYLELDNTSWAALLVADNGSPVTVRLYEDDGGTRGAFVTEAAVVADNGRVSVNFGDNGAGDFLVSVPGTPGYAEVSINGKGAVPETLKYWTVTFDPNGGEFDLDYCPLTGDPIGDSAGKFDSDGNFVLIVPDDYDALTAPDENSLARFRSTFLDKWDEGDENSSPYPGASDKDWTFPGTVTGTLFLYARWASNSVAYIVLNDGDTWDDIVGQNAKLLTSGGAAVLDGSGNPITAPIEPELDEHNNPTGRYIADFGNVPLTDSMVAVPGTAVPGTLDNNGEVKFWTVTFDPNGGNDFPGRPNNYDNGDVGGGKFVIIVPDGESLNDPDPRLAHPGGESFVGWYGRQAEPWSDMRWVFEDAAFIVNRDKIEKLDQNPEDGLTLYAHWLADKRYIVIIDIEDALGPVGDATVILRDSDGNEFTPDKNEKDGIYEFYNVPEGDYAIIIEDRDGDRWVVRRTVDDNTTDDNGILFVEIRDADKVPLADFSIDVYLDTEPWDDVRKGAGPPIITLVTGGGVSIGSADSGSPYAFEDVPHGAYKIYADGVDTGHIIVVDGSDNFISVNAKTVTEVNFYTVTFVPNLTDAKFPDETLIRDYFIGNPHGGAFDRDEGAYWFIVPYGATLDVPPMNPVFGGDENFVSWYTTDDAPVNGARWRFNSNIYGAVPATRVTGETTLYGRWVETKNYIVVVEVVDADGDAINDAEVDLVIDPLLPPGSPGRYRRAVRVGNGVYEIVDVPEGNYTVIINTPDGDRAETMIFVNDAADKASDTKPDGTILVTPPIVLNGVKNTFVVWRDVGGSLTRPIQAGGLPVVMNSHVDAYTEVRKNVEDNGAYYLSKAEAIVRAEAEEAFKTAPEFETERAFAAATVDQDAIRDAILGNHGIALHEATPEVITEIEEAIENEIKEAVNDAAVNAGNETVMNNQVLIDEKTADLMDEAVAAAFADKLAEKSDLSLTEPICILPPGWMNKVAGGGAAEIVLYAKEFEREGTAPSMVAPLGMLESIATGAGWTNEIFIDLWVNAYLWEDIQTYLDYYKDGGGTNNRPIPDFGHGGTRNPSRDPDDPAFAADDYDADALTNLSVLPELIRVAIPLAGTELCGYEAAELRVFRVHDYGPPTGRQSSPLLNTPNKHGEYFEVVNNHVILHVRLFSQFSIARQVIGTPPIITTGGGSGGNNNNNNHTVTLQTGGDGSGSIVGPGTSVVGPGSTGTNNVMPGGNRTYNIVPDPGSRILDVFVNGESVGGVNQVTLNDIREDAVIKALFTDANNYIVDAKAGQGGSVSDPGRAAVPPGTDKTYYFTPDEGYYVSDVIVNGVSMGPMDSFTISNIDGDYTIEVSFSRRPALNYEDHFAYIIGYPDGDVRPHGLVTREETATIFFRLLDRATRGSYLTESHSFDDVRSDRWSNTAIATLQRAAIIRGRPGNRFDPGAPITRAEFAAIAARFDRLIDNGQSLFSDIAGHWAEREINSAAARGWVVGYDGLFRPDDHITRAEAMALVNRVLRRLPEVQGDLLDGMIVWPDNMNPDAWYYLDVQEATNSHHWERKDNGIHERWTELADVYDWKRFER